MRSKVTKKNTVTRLDRLLDALTEDLVQASDEEVLQAARDLGMNPHMRGSAAFIGLRYPSVMRPEEFFDPEALKEFMQHLRGDRSLPPADTGELPRRRPSRSGVRPAKDEEAGD